MTPDKQDVNHRVDARASGDFVMEIYENRGKHLAGIARLLNISLSGVCVGTTTDLTGRSELSVRFLLDQKNLLTFDVKIIWKRDLPHTYQYGLKFNPYPNEYRSHILKFIQKYFTELQELDMNL